MTMPSTNPPRPRPVMNAGALGGSDVTPDSALNIRTHGRHSPRPEPALGAEARVAVARRTYTPKWEKNSDATSSRRLDTSNLTKIAFKCCWTVKGER